MGNKDWVALAVGQATDDEILTEGSRRGLTANIIATHGGTTAKAVLESTTDQRLREECVRRGWRSALVDMTDGQVRSECARRKFNQCGPGDMTLLCVLSRHVPEDFPSSELPSWLESTLLAARVTDAEMAKRLPRNVLAQELRDDELNVECEKRKLISGDLAVVDLVRASDAALRAECTHRDIQTAGAGEHYVPARDYARRESELASERDEWKRRAEAAEAESARRKMVVDAKNEMLSKFRAAAIEYQRRGVECGPGLVASDTGPDNSIAHLPEDLLCDDAP